MTEASSIDLRFEPPGPGTWELDPVHFPRPVTQYWVEIHPAPYSRGVSEFMAYYGMLLDRIDNHNINGFAYRTSVPVADAEVPERCARAEAVWAEKLWREQLREWDDVAKPGAIMAREYGIPGVVGTRDATERIPDGTLVRVDGDAGEVTVHS